MVEEAQGRQRPPTLDDVAALAGVGRGTVSRAINGAPNVSEHSRASIMAAVEKLGYVPNKAARSLVTRRTDSVTLVISESEERFFSEPFFADVGARRSAVPWLSCRGRCCCRWRRPPSSTAASRTTC